MMGAPAMSISFLYPGACCITCSRNRSWILFRAGARFSFSSTGRMLSVTSKAVLSPRIFLTCDWASFLPA